uniref:TRIM8/14/16/25/29/45/65 coiled-coil region domain-containing protein n=1 Tax=Oryctolagus cuniculus TaxID=9986 RepID=G1SZ32_RABIT
MPLARTCDRLQLWGAGHQSWLHGSRLWRRGEGRQARLLCREGGALSQLLSLQEVQVEPEVLSPRPLHCPSLPCPRGRTWPGLSREPTQFSLACTLFHWSVGPRVHEGWPLLLVCGRLLSQSWPSCCPVPQAQLRARLEVTARQTTEVETQLQELQRRSREIQVQGLPGARPATPPAVPCTPSSREGGAVSQVLEEEVPGTLAAPSPPLSPVGSPGPGHAEASPGPAQSSACTLSSVASSKFSCLMQALELQRTLALRDIQAAETQALAQAREEEQRLQGHLDALARDGCRIRALLEQGDDQTFLQESQQLPEPPQPAGPLTLPQWDEDQQLGPLKESLSALCDLLLQGGSHPRAPAKAADLDPVEAPGPLAPVGSTLCPLRRRLWQNYRNLTFDAGSANCHFYLSRQDQQVQHRRQPRGPAEPGSFELWQVQCAQSFRSEHHYWEVRALSTRSRWASPTRSWRAQAGGPNRQHWPRTASRPGTMGRPRAILGCPGGSWAWIWTWLLAASPSTAWSPRPGPCTPSMPSSPGPSVLSSGSLRAGPLPCAIGLGPRSLGSPRRRPQCPADTGSPPQSAPKASGRPQRKAAAWLLPPGLWFSGDVWYT